MLEKIILAIVFVSTLVIGFDFIVFVLKTGAKCSYFTKTTWKFGFLTTCTVVYWILNGYNLF